VDGNTVTAGPDLIFNAGITPKPSVTTLSIDSGQSPTELGYTLDSTINQNDPSSQGSVTFDNGLIYSGIELNGTDAFLQVPTAVSLDGIQDATIGGWFYFDAIDTGTDGTGLFALISATDDRLSVKALESSKLKIINNIDGSGVEASSVADVITIDGWYFVVLTITSGEWKLYVNAVEKITDTSTKDISDIDDGFSVRIGSSQDPTETFHDGGIDQFYITDVVRSQDWITTEYNNQVDPAAFFSVSEDQSKQVAMPTFNPPSNYISSGTSVSINCATAGSTIYYTTDGSTPTIESSVYSTPFTITEAITIKAFAVKDDLLDSNVATGQYTIGAEDEVVTPLTGGGSGPIFSLVQGQYPSNYIIEIGCPDPDKTIYYTTDGSTPTSSSTLYTGPIPMFNGTLKAVAI
jgi:hypothetical protein